MKRLSISQNSTQNTTMESNIYVTVTQCGKVCHFVPCQSKEAAKEEMANLIMAIIGTEATEEQLDSCYFMGKCPNGGSTCVQILITNNYIYKAKDTCNLSEYGAARRNFLKSLSEAQFNGTYNHATVIKPPYANRSGGGCNPRFN
jgi:hypothetical protein